VCVCVCVCVCVQLPQCLSCGFSAWLTESELWMSSGGTSSLLHSHADHDLHCVIAGRKDFILIERQFKHVFHFVDRVRPTSTDSLSTSACLAAEIIEATWPIIYKV